MPEVRCGFKDSPDGTFKGSDFLVSIGPSLAVDIGFDSGFKAGMVPKPNASGVAALVDTGATECCIDAKLAADLNLPIVDRRMISGSNGAHMVNVHLAQVHMPSLGFTMFGTFASVDLTGGGQPHQALIGRSFLKYFTMIYSGPTGEVTLFS